MALIKCSECGKEISDKATICPSCGAPNLSERIEEVVRTTTYGPFFKRWQIAVAAIILAVGVACRFLVRHKYNNRLVCRD